MLSNLRDIFSVPDIKYIIATNQCLTNISTTFPIHPLLSVKQLKIHVAIERN